MTTTIVVSLEGLGLCEHCATPLSIEGMPADSMDADWCCPHCGKILSGLSFGYEGEGQGTRKVKWVGPEGKWVAVKPTQDFELGD